MTMILAKYSLFVHLDPYASRDIVSHVPQMYLRLMLESIQACILRSPTNPEADRPE